MTIKGVYVGNSTTELQQFENWLGAEVDAVHGVVGFANWTDFTNSAKWMVNTLWKGINEEILWSVPIIVNDGSSSLAKAATGAYDGYYRQVAQTLLAGRAGDSDPIYVRTGWEANGDWFFWNAIGKEAAFKGAFQHFADAFHGVSNRFKIEWNINYAEGGIDPATIYPGDKYVDVIGMDFYWVLEHQGTDPTTAWNKIQNAKYGLNWLENFAKAHGKPTAYSEWGIESNNAGPYLAKAKAWFDSHNVAYQSYWDYTMGGDVIALSDGTLPASGGAFKQLFGAGSTTTPPVIPPTEPTTGTTPPGVIAGTSGKEALNGTSGADTLRGSGGDTLSGGAGDDTYEVNSLADIVVEASGNGTDTVTTWIDGYVLPDNVENLVLTGTGWNTASGNGLANSLTGNDSANILNGRGGNDLLTGGGGNDTFVIARGEGNDTITDFRAGVGAGDVLKLDGFSFADFAALKAAATQSGADLVIRLASDQTLTLRGVQLSSLASDDVSLVNIKAAAPTPVVPPTTPTDSGSPALGGATTNTIRGTSAREALNGTSGNDLLLGSGGDTLSGGAGDDTYEVNSLADIVVETSGNGIDTVTTWIDGYVLPDNVENLVLTGTGWNTASGNALANSLTGNDSANILNGRGGNDLLTGGGGNDTFVIAGGEGNDTITDFRAGVGAGDVLRLDGFSFADFAALKAAATQSGADLVIRLASDQTLTLRGVQLSSLASDDVSLVNIKAAAPTPVVTAPVATTPTTTGGTAAASVATTNNIWGGTGTDTLHGTDANDRIASVGGSDRMSGGKGNDTYVIYSGTEQVIEKAGEGVDTVETWIGKYALAANVENLVIIGTSWTQGTGNDLANTIVGNSSPNVLDGRGGNDLLTGGRGNDTFVIGKGLGMDTITDFRPHAWGGEADTIQLTGFGSGARLSNAGSLFSVTASDGSVTQFTLNGVTSLGSNDLVWA
ncbi:glycosyl hydrolase [Muricoccus pecuniae]|uniref:Ca2+-binding RTX toxin-like protein n=1 Tax=Muricoccus pecuniae TaxID=693023 RepID=A0A840Y479_9PROT|nr:glycosyl hydrolase [Roseomonas pecuniae]MBB5694966.1 Ca2+-binding RTX toxin-like protein [Roseomonas pecuniae]